MQRSDVGWQGCGSREVQSASPFWIRIHLAQVAEFVPGEASGLRAEARAVFAALDDAAAVVVAVAPGAGFAELVGLVAVQVLGILALAAAEVLQRVVAVVFALLRVLAGQALFAQHGGDLVARVVLEAGLADLAAVLAFADGGEAAGGVPLVAVLLGYVATAITNKWLWPYTITS